MATINLAPGTQYLAAIRRRRRFIFGLSALVVVGIAVVWGGLFALAYTAEQRLEQAQGDLHSLERAIAEAGPDVERITLFEQRLAAVDALLNRHTTYTPVLREIERLLPPPTALTSLSITTEGAVAEISGTTPTIDEVSQALASLTNTPARKTIFTEAALQSILRNEIKSVEGAPSVIEYIFKAKLPFDVSVLYNSAP